MNCPFNKVKSIYFSNRRDNEYLKGNVAWDFSVWVFLHESIQKAPDERQKTVKYFLVTSRRYLCTKFDFLQIIPQKGMPFRHIIRGKSKFAGDYAAERHAFPGYNPRKGMSFRELFCVKAGFSLVKSTESFNFLWIFMRKSMPFYKISYGKFQLTAESQNPTF
jgi:hypothetical protein